MQLDKVPLPSRPVRLLVAILMSAFVIVLGVVPANPLGTRCRKIAVAIIFVAYAVYVELSRNNRGHLQIALWKMVLVGAISGGTIAMLIRSDFSSALMGFGIGAVLGVFADQRTAFVLAAT